ncbi:hypothetical protein E1B28_010773 [Marasmius oreades]|uniref:Uncharacterized protein n=1 Tax=Marasmius oreades TaxID=181124 RepID=A0A9P7RTD9_9AGAR|nr:uncharacterized protein E1B28_010773 [Marasmius oreades]KAG7089063.1 hypothetical protein E1B28_010773 [Marasmius oreades]
MFWSAELSPEEEENAYLDILLITPQALEEVKSIAGLPHSLRSRRDAIKEFSEARLLRRHKHAQTPSLTLVIP